MKVGRCIEEALDAADASKMDSLLLFASIAVDGTARKVLGRDTGNRTRYVSLLRDYLWLLEPMAMRGINLVDTVWDCMELPTGKTPTFPEIAYEMIRCNLAHGDEFPESFDVLPEIAPGVARMTIEDGVLRWPITVAFGLLACAILDPTNREERVTSDDYYFSLANQQYRVNDWWGRADDFRPIAAEANGVRVKLEGLGNWDSR